MHHYGGYYTRTADNWPLIGLPRWIGFAPLQRIGAQISARSAQDLTPLPATRYVELAPLVGQMHIVLGLFGLPMELMLSTDAYYFGLLPVTLEVVGAQGVEPASVVYALTIGNIIGTFISPFSPALWLALGLAGLDLGRHIRYSLWWMWGFSLVLFGAAWALGLF